MKHLKTNKKWLDQLIPEGILVPSSAIISGPGGSGKPIISKIWGIDFIFLNVSYLLKVMVRNNIICLKRALNSWLHPTSQGQVAGKILITIFTKGNVREDSFGEKNRFKLY